jgi:hypothetical protein
MKPLLGFFILQNQLSKLPRWCMTGLIYKRQGRVEGTVVFGEPLVCDALKVEE